MIAPFAALLLVVANQQASVRDDALVDAPALLGTWVCHGQFVKSRRPLDATVSIARSDIPNTLLVDHRDVPPSTYRSTEIWSLASPSPRAAIADASGMRWFDGKREGGNLVFTRIADGSPLEQFVYRIAASVLNIEWFHGGVGGALSLGDELACRRPDSGQLK